MKHEKFYETNKLVEAGIPVLLTGERGSGKTTLVKHVAESLGLKFFTMSMTRQTTLSHLLGFMNVNGIYIPSQLRAAVEEGGIFLLDEIDAADPNVILCLNTIENGYVSFPDKVVKVHKDFRLMATSNPQDNHREYNGRAKLDAATMDRFDIVTAEKDSALEQSIVDYHTYSHMELARKCLRDSNSHTYLSMRDSIRLQKRRELNLSEGFIERLLQKDLMSLEKYNKEKVNIPEFEKIEDCESLSSVWEYVPKNAVVTKPSADTRKTPEGDPDWSPRDDDVPF